MDPAVRQALLWTVLGVAVVLAGFTILDVASGVRSTALWISLVAWPLVAVLTGWILKENPYNPDEEN